MKLPLLYGKYRVQIPGFIGRSITGHNRHFKGFLQSPLAALSQPENLFHKQSSTSWFIGHPKSSNFRLSNGSSRLKSRPNDTAARKNSGWGEIFVGGRWRKICFYNWPSELTQKVCL